MDIFRISLAGLILVVLLAFRFKTDESRFEINRLAEHNVKYKTLARFLDLYPGLIILVRVLALVDAILLTIFAAFSWGFFGGGTIAFAAVLLAWILGHMLHGVAETLIGKYLGFFNKYFTWSGYLGRIAMVGDEPHIGSEHELVHLVEQGDFIDEQTKVLLKNTLAFRDRTIAKAMTPRDRIAFVHVKDALTPKLLDELFISGHKIFPVVQGSLDHTEGLLYLDDVLPVEQEEKILSKTMRKCPPPIDQSAPLEAALNQMCEYHCTALMVVKNDKVVGFLLLKDIMHTLFSVAE